MICHYWYFVDSSYKDEPEVCDDCHNMSMMAGLIIRKYCNTECVDYRCVIWYMSKSDAISRLRNSE